MSDTPASNKNQPVFLKAVLPVRNPQNSRFNGEWDDEHNPKMPLITKSAGSDFADHAMTLVIDIKSGKVQDWTEGDVAQIDNKVIDAGVYSILNQDGDALVVTENHYVPAALQLDDDGYDDYVRITIEEEGYIREWYPPLVQQMYKP